MTAPKNNVIDISPSEYSDKKRIRSEQVRLLYKNSLIALFGGIICVLVVAVWLINFTPVNNLHVLVWTALNILVTLFRYFQVRRYKASTVDPDSAYIWEKKYILGIIFSGLLWGSAGVILIPASTMADQVILSFFIAGLSSATVSAYSSVFWASPAFVFPAVLPIAVNILLRGGETSSVIGGMLLFFTVMLLFITRNLHATTYHSLRLKMENTGLISYLRNAKEESEKLNEVLKREISERQQETENRQKSEQDHKLLVETMNEGLMRVDNNNIIQFVNDRMCAMLGYIREELLGKSTTELLLTDENRTIMEEIARSRLAGRSDRYEIQIKKKNGELIWVYISGSPIIDADGNVTGSIGILTDITLRKKVELELERFREVMDRSGEAIFIADVDSGCFIDVNETACRMLDYTRDELLNLRVKNVLKDQKFRSLTNLRKFAKDINKADKPYFLSETVKGSNKKNVIPAEAFISCKTFEDKDYLVIVLRDISEQKKAEEALRKSEERLRTLFSSMYDIVFEIDRNGCFTDYYQPALTELYGPQEKFVGKNFRSVLPEDVAKKLNDAIEKVDRTGRVQRFDYSIDRNGKEKWFFANVGRVMTKSGDSDSYIIELRDITERKQVEEVMNQRLAAMKASRDGIAIHNDGGDYIFINDAYATIYGYEDTEAMMGTLWSSNYDTLEWKRLESEFAPKLRNEGYWNGEGIGNKRDGSRFPQTISLSQITGGGTICIIRDISDKYISERTTTALYNISSAASSDITLNELFKYIHLYLGTIIDTTNFYIALYDEQSDTISFPYFVDQYSKPSRPFKSAGSGYSVAQVIRTKQPNYHTDREYKEYVKKGELKEVEHVSKVWVGVPLISKNEVIGAMVVQSYSDPNRYSKSDISLLEFVSGQIAIAIESKKTSEALMKSEEQIKNLSNQIGQLSLSVADIIAIEDINELFERISGAIVEHSDFRRVLISLFQEEPPYREIVGYKGVDKKTIDRLRKMESPKEMYLTFFEKGLKVGQYSYYVPHTMKNILRKEATLFGKGAVPPSDDLWHPEDNLFVRMNDREGNLIGVISVDESKSLQKPTNETVRPLEIFSKLISQLIIQRKSEQQMKMLEEELFQSQKMESIGKMAGGIAHDFNNILAIMMGYADMLKQQFTDLSTEEGRASNIIFKNVKRASDLTKQLLNFARGGKYVPELLNINDEIVNIVKISEKIFEKKIKVSYDFQKNIKAIEADKNQMGQIFTNLIINAKEAMPGSGSITFQTKNYVVSEDGKNRVTGLKPGSYVLIKISDSGEGMSEETAKQVFEPFFTKKPKGIGLGLATVYRIVKNHKGYISVESKPGKGTTFSLYFPSAQSTVIPKKVEKVDKKVIHGNETILVVDDENDVKNLVTEMLESMDYKVMQASDGKEAVKVYKKNHRDIDMILLDMIMPEMSGHEAFFKLRTINPQARILIVSGYSQDDKTADVLESGALGFLPKPFSLNQLSEQIARSLKQ